MISEFVGAASSTLDIAIYDLRLEGEAADTVVGSLRAAVARGVEVRVLFNLDHGRTIAVPPPPSIDWDLLHRLQVPFHPVSGVPDLMHHKYAIRDGGDGGAVLTGSTNWTSDSWAREENVMVTVASGELAADYRRNFQELWESRIVSTSGQVEPRWIGPVGAGTARIRAFFNPGRAHQLVHEIAERISGVRRRLRICTPVLTSGPILASLAETLQRPDLDVLGVYDRTQMRSVLSQWRRGAASTWKLAAFESVLQAASFAGKASTPYSPGSVHNFMHAKIAVVDDTVFVGSYNLSHSGEANAENVLEIEDAAVADRCAEFVEAVHRRYLTTLTS